MATKVVVGAQYGDEGKGKVIDHYSKRARMIVRYGGGANAGHTIEANGQKLITHLVPSGIMHPDKICVMGNQMVICPETLWQEITELKKIGLLQNDLKVLKISNLAHIVMPYCIALDKLREAATNKEIGTTGRGIGPTYELKAARKGIRMGDLKYPDTLTKLVEKNLAKVNPEIEMLGGTPFVAKDMIDFLNQARERFVPYITNVNLLVYEAWKNYQEILFEGAQGMGLDIDHGTYPFVTSSNTLSAAACLGSGIGPSMINEVIGVAKAYITRVGKGPFPTKITNDLEETLRKIGGEYGATTGRPRDIGWMDLPQLKYSARVNGMTGLFITKLDVLRGINPVRICDYYELGNERFYNMDEVDGGLLDQIKPHYLEFPGFNEDISDIKSFDYLPAKAKSIADNIARRISVRLIGVSVGPNRDQTIIVDNYS